MCVMPTGWIYIMTNRPNGTLYVGVTNDLTRRVGEHQMRTGLMFTTRYGLDRLVYVEAMATCRPPSSGKRTSSTGRGPGK